VGSRDRFAARLRLDALRICKVKAYASDADRQCNKISLSLTLKAIAFKAGGAGCATCLAHTFNTPRSYFQDTFPQASFSAPGRASITLTWCSEQTRCKLEERRRSVMKVLICERWPMRTGAVRPTFVWSHTSRTLRAFSMIALDT
jgi:hypothetical protein